MDENKFFHEATLKICSSLDIEKALWHCFMYVKDFIPADLMTLTYMSPDLGGVRTVARANVRGGERLDHVISLPSETVDRAISSMRPEVIVIDQPEEHFVLKHTVKYLEIDNPSIIVDRLIIEGKFLGAMNIIVEGSGKYTDEHAHLFSLLREPASIALSNCLRYEETVKLKELLADDNRYLHGELRRLSGDEIIGANFGLKDVMHKVQQVAALDSPVLLLGETGVGKDVIANTIHYSSLRSNGPFVSVNCGAIPDTLLDSELFGHEKGAFTGALSQKRGRFERANKGTIFLDEIGELPFQAQVRFLKVLQSKEIERVGGVKTIPLDIRIIAATNRDLEEMVKLHEFREDLWFRINVFPLWIPPLRERKEDIPALLQHFINLKTKELKLPNIPTLSSGAIDPLMEYHWPGNVRELENVIERALILNPTGPLTFEHLITAQPKKTPEFRERTEESDNLDEIVSRQIRRILAKTKGKVNGLDGAAAFLGINPSTLRNRMKKLGIDYGRQSKS